MIGKRPRRIGIYVTWIGLEESVIIMNDRRMRADQRRIDGRSQAIRVAERKLYMGVRWINTKRVAVQHFRELYFVCLVMN